MRPTPETIWKVPAYLPCIQPPLSEELIAATEEAIGHPLPKAYLALLHKQNGGSIRYTLPDLDHSHIYGIGPYYPSLTKVDWQYDRERVSFELDGLIPFEGDPHWSLCLDYRKNPSNPSITYIELDCDQETEVADSFDDYLDLLQPAVTDDEYLIPYVPDLDALLAALSTAIGTKFESLPSASSDYGHPIYRATDQNPQRPGWIWLSPNLVRRGFVPEDHARYEELRHLSQEEALRHPNLHRSAYILTMTGGMKKNVFDAFQKLAIDIRPLVEYAV